MADPQQMTDEEIRGLAADPAGNSLIGTGRDLTESFMERELSPSIQVKDVAEFAPGSGEVLSAQAAEEAAGRGDWPEFAIDALGAVPVLGGISRPVVKSLNTAADMLRAFSSTPVGKRFLSKYEGDFGNAVADVFDGRKYVDPKDREKAMNALFKDEHAYAYSASKQGQFSPDTAVQEDVKTVSREIARAVKDDLQVGDFISKTDFAELGNEELLGAGDAWIRATIYDLETALPEAHSGEKMRDIRDAIEYLKVLLEATRPFSAKIGD